MTQMIKEQVMKKWSPVLTHESFAKISDPYRKYVTSVLLENNQVAWEEDVRQGADMRNLLTETLPANAVGTGGYGGGAAAGGPVAGFDPILISLIRRSLPNLIAYDVCGVQPMIGPTGLIFAMRSKYANNANLAAAAEALFNEANDAFSGNGTMTAFDTANVNPGTSNSSYFGLANTGYGFPTTIAEDLGDVSGNAFAQMGFSIEKVTVTANTRALQASYTLELAQDLKAVHGLDAETELSNILSTEILAEINREVIRTIYATAAVGVQYAATPGIYNLAVAGDSSGRWQVEIYKGLIYALERECNKIGKDTRRGKGNVLITSTDVASALAMSGMLDYQSALTNNTNLNVDDTGNTFAGTLFGRLKVYVDPYSVSGADYIVAGYKGNIAYDAGLFYCPYVPLQMVRAIDPNTFQPKIGFKTRYGIVANPFAQGLTQGLGALVNNSNIWYRKFVVSNLK